MTDEDGGDPGALRRYAEAALDMDDELEWHVRSVLAQTSAPASLVTVLERFGAANTAADLAVLAVARRLAAADAGGLLDDNVGWFTLAGARWTPDTAKADLEATFRRLHRTELSRAGLRSASTAEALRFEATHRVRVRSTAGHYQKVADELRHLDRLRRSGQLGPESQLRLEREIRDLRSAKALADASAAEAGSSPTRWFRELRRIEHVREVPAQASSAAAAGPLATLANVVRASTTFLLSPFVLLAPTSTLPLDDDRFDELA